MDLDVRGTPAARIRAYLREIGGREQSDGTFSGPGWTAALTTGEHRAFGAVFPRVVVRFDGEPGAVNAVREQLKLRATRVGG